jgi:lipopolysaccharide/colanic/teichoic acid biosynthesis glycosyltransferase
MLKSLGELERKRLMEALHQKYANPLSLQQQRFTYWRKKYTWIFIVQGTKILKRIFDIICSFLLLILVFPVMLIIAFLIKILDGSPIFYSATRVGKWGKLFSCPKFRTMSLDAPQLKKRLIEKTHQKKNVTFKMKDDPRITQLGRILRKTSLDELPQLWCVFLGEMSLVGPRPPLPEEVAKYSLEERQRLDVKPGITGIWQVSGRSELSFSKQVKLDLQYIESQSFWLDMKLLLKTIPAVFFGRGAY